MPESPLLAHDRRSPTRKPVELDATAGLGLRRALLPAARRSRPSRTPATRPGRWTLAWVVPPWRVGSGGHTTIFRLIRQLELRGHRCAIFVFDPFGHSRATAAACCASEIREHFVPASRREVFLGLDDFDSADVGDRDRVDDRVPGPRPARAAARRPTSSRTTSPSSSPPRRESIWAEETYRMGYRCIAYTPWMADILRDRYGLEARWFECGTDLDVFPFAGEEGRERGADRRLRAARDRSAARSTSRWPGSPCSPSAGRRSAPCCSARASDAKLPFAAEDLGVVPPRRLAELYREASGRASCSRSPPTRWWRTR